MTYLALIGLGGTQATLPEPVAEYLLLKLRAVEVLYNQWLFVSDLTAEQVGAELWPLMDSATDCLAIFAVGDNRFIRNIDLSGRP